MARGRRAVKTPKKRKWPLALAILLITAAAAAGMVWIGYIPSAQAQPAAFLTVAEDISFAEESSEAGAASGSIDPADAILPGEGISVCVDPGHGDNDPGTHDPNNESRVEKDDVLKFSLVLKEKLEAQGIEVVMTRADDSLPSLSERCEIANEAKVDYYLSIHRNSAAADACGIEIWRSYYSTDETAELGEAIMAGLEGVGIQKNRGVNQGSQAHDGDYMVLRGTKMPSLLLEMGFMQNEEDNHLFDEHQEDYAEAITQAVLSTYQLYHSGGDETGSASDIS